MQTLKKPRTLPPIGVHIDVKYIRDWLTAEDRYGIDITSAWQIVRTNYCANLVARGTCPRSRNEACLTCRANIRSIFVFRDVPRNPEALAAWRARDAAARANETWRQAEHDPAPDSAGDFLFPGLLSALEGK